MTEASNTTSEVEQGIETGPVGSEDTSTAMASSKPADVQVVLPTYIPVRDDAGRIISASARKTGLLDRRGSCLVSTMDDRVVVLVFPEGMARWTAQATLKYKERTYELGDRIDLAGGFMSPDEVSMVKGLESDCPNRSFWKVG